MNILENKNKLRAFGNPAKYLGTIQKVDGIYHVITTMGNDGENLYIVNDEGVSRKTGKQIVYLEPEKVKKFVCIYAYGENLFAGRDAFDTPAEAFEFGEKHPNFFAVQHREVETHVGTTLTKRKKITPEEALAIAEKYNVTEYVADAINNGSTLEEALDRYCPDR